MEQLLTNLVVGIVASLVAGEILWYLHRRS